MYEVYECHLCEEEAVVGEVVGVGGVGMHGALVKILDFVEHRRPIGRLPVQQHRQIPEAFGVEWVGGDSCLEQLLGLFWRLRSDKQCAAWASSLITQKHKPAPKKENQGINQNTNSCE